ncbi:hypothetical protein L873DRAFT_1796044 [Choiromyces venosus 120613-1]|uniref:Ankyrin n=1 Tax=Choiromyces venosus 120613-1 TaxID=1336337 RepID=A0A3N4IUB7_9PEZI|nr:hypothetical protein L873DRAFT_1796044 [Choiromyces venosus 120613-1]
MPLTHYHFNLEARDFCGETALSLATSEGHSPVVKLLSKYKCSLCHSSDISEVPEHPSPQLLYLLNPSSPPSSPCGSLDTDSDYTPLGMDQPEEHSLPELFDLLEDITPSASPPIDPDTAHSIHGHLWEHYFAPVSVGINILTGI